MSDEFDDDEISDEFDDDGDADEGDADEGDTAGVADGVSDAVSDGVSDGVSDVAEADEQLADVDPAVRARLADIAAAPLSEHAEAYQQLHSELQQALADIEAS